MTQEEYIQYNDRVTKLMDDAASKGLEKEAGGIYVQNTSQAIIGNVEDSPIAPEIKKMFPSMGRNEIVELRSVNIHKICEELEKLLNPN